MTPAKIDTAVGVGAASVGSFAAYLNIATEVLELATLGANFIVAVGGTYLIWKRISRINEKNKQDSNTKT